MDVNLIVELRPVDSKRPSKEIIVNCSTGYDTMIKDVQCNILQVSMMFLKNGAIQSDTQCVLLELKITDKCKSGMLF